MKMQHPPPVALAFASAFAWFPEVTRPACLGYAGTEVLAWVVHWARHRPKRKAISEARAGSYWESASIYQEM